MSRYKFKKALDNHIQPGEWGMGVDNHTRVRCPKCRGKGNLRQHTIDSSGEVEPSLVCPYDKIHNCDFHEFVILEDYQKPNS